MRIAVRFAAYLLFLGFCLLLGGCSQVPAQMIGPQGAADPLPMGDGSPEPQGAGLLARPMRRRRRNADLGRSVAPSDDIACGGKACGCGGDYPLWLLQAQEQDGQYIGCSMEALSAAAGPAGLPLSFAHYAAETAGQDSALAPVLGGRMPDWSCLFADWCLANAADPKTGRSAERLSKGAGLAENWLAYGAAAQPCLGALMIARQDGRYRLSFCVGALSADMGTQNNVEPERRVYLGLGVKPVSMGNVSISKIGLVAFAADEIAAFRLPRNYRPCKEHYKLEQTVWARQFQARLAEKRLRQEMILPSGAEPIAVSASASVPSPALPQSGDAVPGGNAQEGFAAAQFQPAAFSQAAVADECAAGMNDRDLEAAIERDLQARLSRELGAPQFHA